MDPRLNGPLRDALIAFLQQEGLAQQPQQAPQQSMFAGRDPAMAGFPMLAPQSVQSGAAPTPQNVGQTLGPQRGEPRNVTRQQWMQDFGQAAGSFGASAADPLGIPSALLGTVAPGARDSWRQYQGAAGPVVQMAGGMASGLGAANAMIRGGNALAGIPGMIAGGAATGAAPSIDYAAGAPGADGVNALAGPLSGAALPAGMAVAGPALNAIRNNPMAAAAGGATALAAGSAVAQQATPQLDEFTRNLHANSPALAAAYQRMIAARQAASSANQTSVAANQGRQTNSGARQAAERADAAAAEAARAYEELLQRQTDATRAANPSFREAYGPIAANRLVRSTAIPFALGLIGGAGSASLGRITNRMARNEVAAGNSAMTAGNIEAAAGAAANANALANPTQSWWQRVLPPAGMGLSGAIGMEGALLPNQWNQEATPGSPERIAADNYMSTWRPWVDGGLGALMGASAFKGGKFVAQQVNNMIPGRNRVPATTEAAALQRRVDTAQSAPQPAPPTVVSPAPQQNNMPIDYEAIARGIRPQFERPPYVPPALMPAPPAPPVAAADQATNAARRNYTGTLRDNTRDAIASAVEAGQAVNARSIMATMQGLTQQTRERIAAAIRSVNDQMAQPGADLSALGRRIRSGQFPGLSVFGPAVAAAAAAHHSVTQPRGDDGRFVVPE